ncbi:hypothetical protein BGX28_001834, partial [Mortierella sp. GBA30]
MIKDAEKIRRQAEDGMDSFRDREAKFPLLESSLWMYCEFVIANRGPLHDDVLIEKALEIALGLGMDPDAFKASQGWLLRFKQRKGLHQIHLHGEASSVDEASLPQERERLQNMIREYSPDDV